MGEFIDNFDPCGKEFKFNFTRDTCAQIRTGICELQNFDSKDNKGINRRLSRCQGILSGLLDGKINSINNVPYIHKHTCNHWSCTDGQHRICVAQRMELTLKVEQKDCNEVCSKCHTYYDNQKSEVIKIQL